MAKLDTKVGAEKEHATYSASGASRWLGCPGSINLCEKAPEAPEGRYAAEGTKAHKCLEFLLKNRRNEKVAVATALKTYSAEMVTHAAEATKWILDRAEETGGEVLSEQQVDSSPFTCEGQFGTLDAAIVDEFGTLTVVDYKYGAGIAVDPAGDDDRGNPQLVYYALGLSHLYHHNFLTVELVVIQPRAFHESGNTTRSFAISMDALLEWEPIFRDGVKRTKAKDPPLATGSWCRFCSAATICPELKSKAMLDAQIVFDDAKGIESVPEPKLIVLPHLGTVLDACDKLEAWIGKVREHAVHVLESGQFIDGFKLVAKRSPRRWIDAENATAEAIKKFGDLALTEPKLLSPAQLEKAAKGTKDLDKWISDHVTDESSGTTLVRETDKRPAVETIDQIFNKPVVSLLPAELFGKVPKVRKSK